MMMVVPRRTVADANAASVELPRRRSWKGLDGATQQVGGGRHHGGDPLHGAEESLPHK
jgi:hypothetical protein